MQVLTPFPGRPKDALNWLIQPGQLQALQQLIPVSPLLGTD